MKKFFKVYSGPGYPVDPALEIERINFIPTPEPECKPFGTCIVINPNGMIPILYK